ncbi:hypothetical protein U1Q18_019416 [Sarracenia purpurea var. burkii]
MAPQEGLSATNFEAVKRAQEIAAKMGFQQDPQFAPLINLFPRQMPPVVNINKQKKEAFQIFKPELDVDPDKNPHIDPRMGIDTEKLLSPKRNNFQFVEEGKWSKEAKIIKLKSQFGEAQAKELKAKQQLAKAKAEPDINPNLIEVSERVITKEKPKELIPEIKWWNTWYLLVISKSQLYNFYCNFAVKLAAVLTVKLLSFAVKFAVKIVAARVAVPTVCSLLLLLHPKGCAAGF